MGNVLEQESITTEDADTTEDDLKWLAVKGSMVFNDNFLEEEYANLPAYQGTEVLEDQGSGTGPGLSQELSVGRSGDMNGADAVRRMLQLLGPQGEASGGSEGSETAKAGQGTSVEDFPALLGESYLREATHSTATRMRSRLFQRIHLAVVRRAYHAMGCRAEDKEGKGDRASHASWAFALPPSPPAEGKGETDPVAILTSASMRMSLTLMGALRATCPGLFASMAQTLMDIFGASAPFALRQLGSTSAYRETLSRVREVTEAAATAGAGSSKEERAEAIALLLSLGIATGCMSDVIHACKFLLEEDAPALPPSARPSVERLKNHSHPPKVTIPRPNAWTASFPARLDSGKDGSSSADPLHNQGSVSGSGGSGRGAGFAATGGGCSNPATDGVYVYVWDPASKRVHKVGTGFHGTLAGNAYCFSKKILDEIRAFKGMEAAEEEEAEQAGDGSPTHQAAVSDVLSPPAVRVPFPSRRQALMGTGLNIGGGASGGSGSSSDGGFSFGDSDSYDSAFSDDVDGAAAAFMRRMIDAAEPGRSRALSDGAVPGGSTTSPPMPGTSPGAPGVETTRMSSTGSLLFPAQGAVSRPPSPSSRAENASLTPDRQGVQDLIEEPQAAREAAADPASPSVAGNATSSLERPPVQLYRVPTSGLLGSLGEPQSTEAVGQTGQSPDRTSAARTEQSPSTMGAIFDAMGALGGGSYDPMTGVYTAGGAGAAGTLAAGGGTAAGGTGLLRFTALLNRELLQHIPESGYPDDFSPSMVNPANTMATEDRGEVLEHRTVHGFHWYRVRATSRPVTNQAVNWIGWVPLRLYDSSDVESLDSDERGEIEGEFLLEFRDPTNDDVVSPDSPRATSPPVWDEALATAAAASAGRAGEDMPAAGRPESRGGGGAAGTGGKGAGSATVRPVWLALVAGKLFLREKASGALSADEIAVLRPSDLSLESIISLAGLPISGFPKSSEATSDSRMGGLKERENAGMAAGTEDGWDGGVVEAAEDGMVEFADTETGACVFECSSNADTSGGVLQNNLLVRNQSQRLPFLSGDGNVWPPSDTAFYFAPSDRDRILVVDLGKPRRVREAGVELLSTPGVGASKAVGSLLVETSANGRTWDTLGSWTAPVGGAEDETVCSATVTAADDSANTSRFVRYTLPPPSGSSSRMCFLTRVSARGPNEEVSEESALGDKPPRPFPAMTTDSRHVILVHATGAEKPQVGENGPSAVLGQASPRRLEIFFLDPEEEYRLVKTATLAWEMDEIALHRNAMLCDGDRLVMLAQRDVGVVQRTADTIIVSMCCRSGAFSSSPDEEGQETRNEKKVDMEFDVRATRGIAPTGLGYDRRNNVMWGWDPVLKKLCRWRNGGLPPVFAPPRPMPPVSSSPPLGGMPSASSRLAAAAVDEKKLSLKPAVDCTPASVERVAWVRSLLASDSPSHRVEGLEEADLLERSEAGVAKGGAENPLLSSRRDAALLLGYLERMGEPYGPPEEPAAEARVHCELEVFSSGQADGNVIRMLVRGEDRSCNERGVHVLVLAETLDAESKVSKAFATHESSHAAGGLAEYLDAVPQGRTVLVAGSEGFSKNLNVAAKRALVSLGAGNDEVTALGERNVFVMIGRKGAKPGSVPQVVQLARYGSACAIVRQRLPAPVVPMCVDVSKETLDSLIALILEHRSVLLQGPGASRKESSAANVAEAVDLEILASGGLCGSVEQRDLDAVVVLSAVNMLTNQMFQLLRGSTPAAALASLSPEQLSSLQALLVAVIDQPQPIVGHRCPTPSSLEVSPRFQLPAMAAHNQDSEPAGHRHNDATTLQSELPQPPAVVATRPPAPREPGAKKAGNAIRKVSCAGVRSPSGPSNTDMDGVVGAGGSGAVSVEMARRGLLQTACLRLFVTVMDLFFPSSAERCNLLARYLSKFLSDNLSPARETVLALLLGRMSDPNQLVELVYCKASQSTTKTPLNNEVNPFIVPSPRSAQDAPSLTSGNASLGGTGVSSAAAAAAVPAPSAIELQSLLLAVATAEGVSKIQALRQRGDRSEGAGGGPEGAESGGKGDGAAERGVRGAAMEMLERLTNQLISTAACIVMQPDLGVPDDASQEEIDAFLKSAGIEPVPAPSRAGKAKANPIRSPHGLAQKAIFSGDMDAGDGKTNAVRAPPDSGWGTTTISGNVRAGRVNANCRLDGFVWRDNSVRIDAKAGDGATLRGDAAATAGGGWADAEAAPEKEFNRSWLGTEVSAASTLVVLTTAMCRSCAVLAAEAVETADATGEPLGDGRGTLSKTADHLLEESPLGALLPMLASSVALLVDKHGSTMLGLLSRMAQEVAGVMSWVSEVLERVPRDRLALAKGTKGPSKIEKSTLMYLRTEQWPHYNWQCRASAKGGAVAVPLVILKPTMPIVQAKTVVMESKHNYESLTNELLFLNINGASRMVITFDERSSTEDGYDFLVFWKDKSKIESWHPRTPKLSGSGYSCNFPGFGGRPPLVIESDRAWIEWKTDATNEDWGWKFTAVAEVKKVASGRDGGGYWLLGLDRQLAGVGAALAGCLVISKPWGGQAEDDNAPWMEDDILAGAKDVSHQATIAVAVAPSPVMGPAPFTSTPVSSSTPAGAVGVEFPPSAIPGESERQRGRVGGGEDEMRAAEAASPPDLALLREVVDRLEGTGGSALCKAMRARVGEDQGTIEAVNRAVYATCAALIWHQGLGVDALALAEGRVTTPSKALSKAWRFGQQMRQYFDYGDVRDAVNSQMELQRQQAVALDASWKSSNSLSLDDAMSTTKPILTRGPSVYQGAEEKVIAEVSERIVSRALFLLSLPSQAGRVSSQEQSKRRWSILAKLGGAGTMTRTTSQSYHLAEGAELLEKWKHVVDEATAMRKLKSILVYRRKAAEMRERAKANCVSERIMQFVQCSADVGELERVRQCRDRRASLRAEGLRLVRTLVTAAASPPAKAWLLSSHSQSIRLTKRDDRPGAHVHYLSCVEGCEPRAHLALARQFALLVKSSLEILKKCSRPVEGETRSQAAERRVLAVSSLQALALDYDVGDHDILKESVLLEVLEPLLEGFNEPGVTGDATPSIENVGIDDGDRATQSGDAADDPTSPQGSSGKGVSDQGDGEEDWMSAATGSIGDDIAALEEELREEEGLLLDGDNGDGEGGVLSGDRVDGKEDAVQKAAWCLFEVLLPRCVGLEGQGLETRLEEPTRFSHRLLNVLVRQVVRASAHVQRSNASLGISGDDISQKKENPLSSQNELPASTTASAVAEDGKMDGGAATTLVGSARPRGPDEVTPLPRETPLLRHGMRLRRDEPGRVAAHRDMTVRHSMAMWLRRDPCPMDATPGLWYSPAKVGDFVARGPRWPLGNMTDGGPGGLGTITELAQSDMTATVQWEATGFKGTFKMGAMAEIPRHAEDESAPASVDDLLVWEVVKVDPAVGGSVVLKGGVNNLTEAERSETWSQFGLSLLGNATLMYHAVSGGDQLFTLHSRTTLQPSVWTHVAVVQAESRCRIYVDGEEDGEARVLNHMLTPGAIVQDVLESQHPYAHNTDRTWDISVEGGVSYTITFDPMTTTEVDRDFVRFLKDGNNSEGDFYGERRYSGGRNGSNSNWPGMGGRPPLVIHASSFSVYFHTDQSNNAWGFKMTCTASVSAPEERDGKDSESSRANLNIFPVYLGQPPGYVSSQRSATGYMWGASTYADALTVEQVRSLARAIPPPEPSFMEEGACTDVLSLVQRCASSMDGTISQGGGIGLDPGASPLVSPEVLGPLLVILLQGSLKLRLAAAKLCEKLLPQASLEMIQVQLNRTGFSSALASCPSEGDGINAAPLVRALLLQIGETLSVWSRPAATATAATLDEDPGVLTFCPMGLVSKESLSSGEEAIALAGAHVGLLRALLAKEGWSAPLMDCLREVCRNLPEVTKSLEDAGIRESRGGCTEEVTKTLCDPSLWMAHALFALLGGSFQGLHVGGRALALLGEGDGATLERCTVLAMDWPRLHYLAAVERETRMSSAKPASKGIDFVCSSKEWKGLKSLGDAVIVCLHSEPDSPRVLPRGRVSPDSAEHPAAFLAALETPPMNPQSPSGRGKELSAAAEAAVAAARKKGTPGLVPYVPKCLAGTLVEAFGVLAAADATDKRDRHKPLVVYTRKEEVLESTHPHQRNVDKFYPLDFPGADSIQLFFDEDCRTEEGTAYIRIYKDERKGVLWGESMYQGRDKDANWPGVHGRSGVSVPASSCVVTFHSEDRPPDWGFRIVATATCKSFTYPPERPPLLGNSALSTLQACGAKALASLVESWPSFVPHALPLIKPLATRAWGGNAPEGGFGRMVPAAKPLSLETEHPYTNNADWKETVRIEGAKKLIITFDDRSRAEQGCDYLTFYADDSVSAVYGEDKYSGGKDGHASNWPGTGGRPPLEIPACHFFFRWVTDASVNDWGWKMTVTPVMAKMNALSLPPAMLDSKMASLLRICRDCPKEQPPAIGLENFETEQVVLPQNTSAYERGGVLPRDTFFSGVSDAFSKTFGEGAEAVPPGVSGGAPTKDQHKLGLGRARSRARVFAVNPRDAEEVSLRAEPRRDSAEVGKVFVNTPLIAIEDSGEWMRVLLVPPGASSEDMEELWAKHVSTAEGEREKEETLWALRQQGDMIYLVSQEEASLYLVTLPDERDPVEALETPVSATGTGTGTGTTAFQLLDPPQGGAAGPASQGAFGMQIGSELVNEGSRLWSALAETSLATASRFSRLALTRILAGSAGGVPPDGETSPPLTLDDFGGADMFLKVIRATFTEAQESGSDMDKAALDVLKKMILDAAGTASADGREVVDLLVAFALEQLETAVYLGTFLCPTKAVVRTWETSHNYADNTDSYYKISIPGAKRIRVVFDEECSTEMGCDFVRIYRDDSHSGHWGEHKYCGPRSSRGKVWAGVAGRPPLMVEADHMVIYFHSDLSNNDWGVRLSAYGIMQEPNADLREQFRKKRKEIGTPETEMACWLLEALAKEAAGHVTRVMYKRSTLSSLTRFLAVSDKQSKIWAVHLLTSLLHNACQPEAAPTRKMAALGESAPAMAAQIGVPESLEVMLEAGGPASALLELAEKQAKVEEDSEAATKSPLLQALLQACLVADECHEMMDRDAGRKDDASSKDGVGSPPGTEDSSFPQWPECTFLDRSDSNRSMRLKEGSTSSGNGIPLLAEPGCAALACREGRKLIRWHVKILGLSDSGPFVGVGTARPPQMDTYKTKLLKQRPWSLTWGGGKPWGQGGQLEMESEGMATRVSFGPEVKIGDTVTVEVDVVKKEVTFYRNQARVGLVGPDSSNAQVAYGPGSSTFPWDDGSDLHLAVTLKGSEDAVQIVPPPLPLCPTIASLSPSGDSCWWGTGMRVSGWACKGDGWFGSVKESLDLLSVALSREIPEGFIAKKLLPECQAQASVQLASPDPSGADVLEKRVFLQGASSLEVVFDVSTSMGPEEKISIFGRSSEEPERVLLGLEGGTDSTSRSDKSPTGGGTKALAGISVGDRVVRGPSWSWAQDQDEGAGGYGTVIDIKTWKGRPGSGVKVRWDDTDFAGLYRWDYEGCFDVLVVAHGNNSTKPIVILGDTLSIHAQLDTESRASSTPRSSRDVIRRLRLEDGANVSMQGWDAVPLDGAFTVEAWFRLMPCQRADAYVSPLMSRGIMSMLSQIELTAVYCPYRGESTLKVEMRASNLEDGTGISLTGGTLLPEQWGHVAFAIDALGHCKLIVDGTEVASGVFRGPRMVLASCDVFLGQSLDTDDILMGHVYDFRLWSRALTVSEVAAGCKAFPASGAPGLLVNFTFTEGPDESPTNRGSCSGVVAVPSATCAWDTWVEPPTSPSSRQRGWSCTVTPTYSVKALGELPELKEKLEAFQGLYGSGDIRHDLALVRYVNSAAEKKGFDKQRVLHCSWHDIIPSEEDLVREPLLRELCLWPPPSDAARDSPGVEDVRKGEDATDGGVQETKGEGDVLLAETTDEGGASGAQQPGNDGRSGKPPGKDAKAGVGRGGEKKGGCIEARFEVLQLVNRKLADAIPYVDLCQVDRKWSAAALLSSSRGLIFRAIKEPVLLSALANTSYNDGGQFDLNLSRSKAAKHIHLGRSDTEGRWTVFGQAFRQMNTMHPKTLRTHTKLYNCVFMGEQAQDAGGPYRESWSMYAQELQSTALPLLIRTPNGVHAAGMGRDRYVPNPGATSAVQVEMFVFLGKIMGHAMRSKEFIGLTLSSVVWKTLVGQQVHREDLDSVDVLLTRSMQDIRKIHQKGVTRAIFSDIVMENFTALSLDDREVELKPGGKNMPVTWDNRLEYADLVESQRLSECCSMAKHIRKGLSMVVPIAVLEMFSWEEAESMICGKPEVDIDLLEAVTEYSGCRREQGHIKLFWQALRDFSPEERSMLVKFTWGRTRLPLTAEGFSQRFKLQNFERSPADDYLPVAHTCFFSLELPAYSSLEVMKERLRNAIYNCQAIDGDDNFAGMQAAAMGWDWEEDEEDEEM